MMAAAGHLFGKIIGYKLCLVFHEFCGMKSKFILHESSFSLSQLNSLEIEHSVGLKNNGSGFQYPPSLYKGIR
jgi:hypothetical protein